MKLKRVISAVLIFCMLISLISTNFNYVLAADDTSMADMDALSALGIDTSMEPEGFDANDTSNPYGKDTVTINPVKELYVLGLKEKTTILPLSERVEKLKDIDGNYITPDANKTISRSTTNSLTGTIYGHENITSKTSQGIMQNGKQTTIASGTTYAQGVYKYLNGGASFGDYHLQTENYDISTDVVISSPNNFIIASSKVSGGNFDGNKEGKVKQNVILYTGKNSKDGGLYMRVGDVDTTEGYGSSKTLIQTTKEIGNPSELVTDVIENFATDPYLIQNYLQVTTGDYDGDGVDEIAVFIPEYGGSRIEVYKFYSTSTENDYKDADLWKIAWTYSLKETNYVSNMVSLVSGDFNEDGITDLGAAWGYYYGPDNNKGSNAVIMFGAPGKRMLQTSQEFALSFDHPKYGNSDIVRASFTFGDLVGSGSNLLVLGGQADADLKNNNLDSRYVAVYNWNGTSFVPSIANNFDLFAEDDDGNLINSNMSINNGKYYSSPLCPANIAVISQGLSEKPYLYLDSLQIQYSDSGLEIIAPLDQHGPNTGNNDYYVEYGAVSGDMVGLGYDTLITMQQTMSSVTTVGSQVTSSSWYYKNWFYKFLGLRTYVFNVTNDSCPQFTPGKTHMTIIDFKDDYVNKQEVDNSTSICMQNTDNDTSYLQYTNRHYFTYSDPKILAVLASPPYFSDLLDRDDLSGNYAESTTSYSSTTGESGGDTFNTTIEAGAYASFEQSFSVFGVEVAKVEAEVSVTAGFTYEMEESSSLEQTVSYTATAGEDMVAFYSIPLEIYEYDAYTSNGDGTYTKQAMTVNIPRTAAVQLLTLESYENIAKDYDILPQISGQVLTHTLGEPGSYSSSESGYLKPLVYTGDWARVGYSGAGGGASISQEIAMSNSSTDSYTIYGRIEAKAGAGGGGVVVGVTVGSEIGGGWVYTTTSGNSFSGDMQNMPAEAEEYGYSHSWKIFSYLYDDGRVNFPIVNYLVRDVVTPPSLPKDFKQNVEKTTATQIAFTWSYDKAVAGFQIYRYYEFPDGTGSYELKFVPMTDGIYDSEDGLYHFEFIDKNLSPYTDYQYQIQTVRASVPNNSIPSQVLTVRTKTDVGYPQYTIEGLDDDGKLKIYPDSDSTIKVIVNNADDYPAGISYQWQKNENGVWQNINGRTTNQLRFSSSGVADQSIYRCRTNVIYFDEGRGDEYYISSYSPEFSTIYSKRTSAVVLDSFKATVFETDTGKDGLRLNVDLISGNTNHFEAPTGNVVFTVKGTDYNADFRVELIKSIVPVSEGPQEGKFTSKASKDILNLPDGVYEISAYYSGSRVFKSLTTPEDITSLIGDSGYQLLLQKGSVQSVSYTYGETITPVLKRIENVDGTISETTTQAGIKYFLDNGISELLLNSAGSFNTPDVGSYILKAKLGDELLVDRQFIVSPKSITIKAVDEAEVGKGFVSVNPPQLKLLLSSMAFNEDLEDLKLGITARNSAGNIVELNDSTNPGNYTIIGNTTLTTNPEAYNNYDVTFVSGVYTIIGQKYNVTIVAEKYQERDVGTMTLYNTQDGKGGEFSASTQLLFIASPYIGYEVDTWSIVATDTGNEITIEPSQLNASKTRLSYTMKAEALTVTVKFKKSENRLTTAMIGAGKINSNAPAFVSGGIVSPGAEIDFTAIAEEGYTFGEWRIESGGVTTVRTGTANSDGSNTIEFTMGSRDTTLRAVFVRDRYTITMSDNLEAVYTHFDDLSGKDVENIVSSGQKITGDTLVLIRVKTGYSLADDAVWMVNGIVTDVQEEGYSFAITENTTVSVDTNQESYTIKTLSDNGTISVKINNNDTIVPIDDIENVPGGSKIVFTANPAHGYAFDKFIVDGTNLYTQNNNTLTINELGGNITLTAEFYKSIDYEIEVNYSSRAIVNYVLYDPSGNEVTRDILTGNIIEVSHGDKVSLIVTPDSGFMVDKWTIDGVVHDINSKVYDLEDISKDMTVSIDVISQISYTVNYTTGNPGGSITSAISEGIPFASGEKDVGGNSKVVIVSSPEPDKMVSYWEFNGEVILNEDGVPFVGKTLTIDSLKSNRPTVDIVVYFADQHDYSVTYILDHTTIDGEFTPDDAVLVGNVREGAKAEFTVTPEDGYRIVSVDLNIDENHYSIVKNSGDPKDEYGTWTITVYNAVSDLTVFAEAKKIYVINMDDVYGGTFETLTETSYPQQAIQGEKVIIEQQAELDCTFVKWDVYGESNNIITITNTNGEFSFVMPDENVTISGEFNDVNTVDIDIEVYDTNNEESGGYNGTISAQIDRDVSGYPKTFAQVTTAGAITGVNRGYTDDYVSWPATRLIINAHPDTDYRVLKWMVNGTVYTSPLNFPVTTDSINEFIMDVENEKDLNIVIQFEQIGEKITYGVEGGHGEIVSAINETTKQTFISGNTIPSQTTIVFEAEAFSGYEVEAWTVDGEVVEGNKEIFRYNANGINGARIAVKFARVPFSVSYSAVNGKVSSPDVLNGKTVRGDTQVTFEATANPGYIFEKFYITGNSTTVSTSNPLTISITDDTIVNASFVPYANIIVNYSVDGGNGSLWAEKGGTEFASGSLGAANDVVIFTASPAPNYKVKEWIVDGSVVNSSKEYSLTVSKEVHNISVKFERSHYVVNFASEGDGTINGSSGSTAILDGVSLLKGSTAVFTAIPSPGYQVMKWKLNGADVAGSVEKLTYTISNIIADTQVDVLFQPIPKYTITIGVTGTGQGTLEASVNGIITPILNNSITVNNHDKVVLKAIPKDEFNTASWTITGASHVTDNYTVNLNDVTSDTTATVRFGVAELISVEAYIHSLDEEPAKGTMIVRAGYKDNLGIINAVGTTINVTKGKTVEFTAVPQDGYMVKQWIIDGVAISDLSNRITRIPETNIKAEVYFEPITAYAIPSSGSNYTVNMIEKIPDVLPTSYGNSVRKSGTVTFDVILAKGAYFKELIISGINCLTSSASPAGTLENIVKVVKNNNKYTITIEKVTANIDSSITTAIPVVTIKTPVNGTITATYSYIDDSSNLQTVTVNSGDNVPAGTELTVKSVANSGYKFASWGDYAYGKSGSQIKLKVPNNDITISSTFAVSSGGGGDIGGGGAPETVLYKIKATAGFGGKITPTFSEIEAGGTDTFIIIPDEGFVISDVLVNGESVGPVSSYTFSNVDEDSTIEAVFDSKTLPIKFTDVNGDDWFKDSVEFVAGLGLFKGTNENYFSPYTSMTRGMFVTVLGRLHEYMNKLSLAQPGALSFADLLPDMYYAPSVKWANDNNIINGYDDGMFKPDESITREQIVVILYRFAVYAGLDTTKTSDITAFTDNEDTSSWAVDAVKWAVGSEIIGGRNDGTLDPQGLAQRCEVAAILHRFIVNFIE